MIITSETKTKYENMIAERKSAYEEKRRKILDSVPGIKEALSERNKYWAEAANGRMDIVQAERLADKCEERIKKLLTKAGFTHDALEYKPMCKTCLDKGFADGRICTCLEHFQAKELFEMSNIKTLMEKENFSSFDIELYSDSYQGKSISPKENMRNVLDKVGLFIKNFGAVSENLFIQGKVGVGKSFLTHCIAKELNDKGYSVMYITAFNLVNTLSDISFGRGDKALYDTIINSDLLIIDDFGCERQTDFSETQILNVINDRIINGAAIIISTNLTASEMNSSYGERIMSRIIGNFTGIKIYGEDLRLRKAAQRNKA